MASLETQYLARRLVAVQATQDNTSAARGDVAAQVVDALRLRLVKMTGVEGFRSLLVRALTLAKVEASSLHTVQVSADGILKGFNEIAPLSEEAKQAKTVLIAFLLELLVTFIGEPLTLNLVRDTWPDASMSGTYPRTEEKL